MVVFNWKSLNATNSTEVPKKGNRVIYTLWWGPEMDLCRTGSKEVWSQEPPWQPCDSLDGYSHSLSLCPFLPFLPPYCCYIFPGLLKKSLNAVMWHHECNTSWTGFTIVLCFLFSGCNCCLQRHMSRPERGLLLLPAFGESIWHGVWLGWGYGRGTCHPWQLHHVKASDRGLLSTGPVEKITFLSFTRKNESSLYA